MKPVLFSFGALHLYSFGLMVALGVSLSIFLMIRRARLEGFPSPNDVYDFVFWTVFGGFLGARIFYVIQNAGWYLQEPLRIVAFWEGGIIFYGGVFGSIFALFILCKIRKVSLLSCLDFLLPFVALTHAFGRIGCFLNGCCYGAVCNLPWAVTFPNLPGPRHPTQLYEAIYDVGLFLFLNARYPKKRFEGEIMAFYFMLYALGRFVIEFWRADNPYLAFFTWNQWISAAIFIVAFIFYKVKRQKAKGKIES